MVEEDFKELSKNLKEKGITCKKLESMIKNKKSDARMFTQAGFNNLAKKERESAEAIKSLKNKVCRRI